MEDCEDDFGDLYADVEAQASSAINGGPGMFPFLSESREEMGSVSDESKINGNSSPRDEASDGSESEDDLNILLNDEDCKNQNIAFEVREKPKREESCRENDEQEGEDDSAAINDQTRNGWTQNAWNQCKGSTSGALWNSGSSQRRHCFSLPRFRSILDVNIDSFEEKPWNHPGADTSDFFNFGLNEDSWKLYCNTVDQFRFSAITRQDNPDYMSQNQPRGRAIQVKDIFCARQPTADERRPRDQDSDVVIQINLEDASNTNEKLELTNCRKEEFSMESREENDKTVDRCSSKENASTPIAREKQSRDKRESEVINACCDDQSMVDSDLSFGEEGQLSLISSCFESDSEASRDRYDLNPGKDTCYEGRSSANSGSELWYSDASHRKTYRDHHTRVKSVDHRNHFRCKTPIEAERKHAIRRVDYRHSDAANMHNRDRLSGNFGRWKNLAHYEEPELSSGYGSKEFAKHDVNTWKSYIRETQYFRKEWDPSLREDRNTRTEHVDYKERSQSYRNNDKVNSRKSNNFGSQVFNYKSTDVDFVQDTCSRIEQRRNGLSKRNAYNDYSRLEQEDFCSSKVNDEFWGNGSFEIVKHQSDQIEDGYWENTDALFSSHQFLREADRERYGRLSSPGEEEQRSHLDYNDLYDFEDRFIFSNEQDLLHEDEIVNRDRKYRRDYFSREYVHDETQADQPGNKIARQRSKWQAMSRRTIKVCRNKNEQQFPECMDSADLFITNGKLSGSVRKNQKFGFDREAKISDLQNEDRRITGSELDKSATCKPVRSNRRKTRKNKERFNDKPPFAVQDDDMEIEEGQIIAEKSSTGAKETFTQDSGMEQRDKKRILETLAKMEKRRERFKEPIKKEQDKLLKPDVLPVGADLPQTMQHRPSRKRRWFVH